MSSIQPVSSGGRLPCNAVKFLFVKYILSQWKTSVFNPAQAVTQLFSCM